MEEKNYHILKKAIGELPVYWFENDRTWSEISKGLPSTIIPGDLLPGYTAPEDLWGKIEKQLNDDPVRNYKNRPIIPKVIRIAATLVFLMMLGIGWIAIRHVHKKQSVHLETVSEVNTNDISKDLSYVSVFDPEICRSNPRVCSTSLFKELDMQWNEVKDEIELLKPELHNNDPQLIKYFYRLDDLRIEIEKKMLKLILET